MLFPLFIATVSALSYPPQSYQREETFESPNHTFQVESWRKDSQEPSAALCVWVVTPDKAAAELLVLPGVLTPLYSVEIQISPDEHWILWEEKLYHGANAYGLFEHSQASSSERWVHLFLVTRRGGSWVSRLIGGLRLTTSISCESATGPLLAPVCTNSHSVVAPI